MSTSATSSTMDGFDVCAWARHFSPFLPELQDNPHAYVDLMRAACPVVHSDWLGGVWIASRYEDVRFILQRHDLFSARINTIPVTSQTPLSPDIPNQIDPPEHGKYRSIINPVLSLGTVDAIEPRMRVVAVELLEGIAARGACNFTTEFAIPFPGLMFCDVMGLPRADLAMLVDWKNVIFAATTPEQRKEVAGTVKRELAEYFTDQYQQRRVLR